MSDLKSLYEEDTVAWAENQAAALRASAKGNSNQPLDWENLAEEIEDLGKRERHDLASRLSTIIEHLLKLTHSPAMDPRNGWRQTIRRSRIAIDRILKASPSLRRELADLALSETAGATELALEELNARGELPRSLQQIVKSKAYFDHPPFTPEQILGDWFPPEPKP
jgi:Domain of unknown function DUF29